MKNTIYCVIMINVFYIRMSLTSRITFLFIILFSDCTG